LLNAVVDIEQKLKMYDIVATQPVFSTTCLADPTTKASFIKAKSFISDIVNWKQKYIDDVRKMFQ